MTWQAYMDNIEAKTGKTIDELTEMAKKKGFLKPETKAAQVVEWLKQDIDLGHGHAMAMWAVIKMEREKDK